MSVIKGNDLVNRLVGENDFDVTNQIYGYGGNDILTGGFFGTNYIWGGLGNDTIQGGAETNTLYGEAGDDNLSAGGSSNTTMYGGSGNDILVGSLWGDIDAEGGSYVKGSYLDGGAGADSMTGGDAADTYVVDNTGDRIIETYVPEYDNQVNPPDLVLSYISFSLSQYLENLTLMGTGNTSGTGSDKGNTIRGNSGANALDGRGGNDSLYGDKGNDNLIGGTGNDTLDGGIGADNMRGGAGHDTYVADSLSDKVDEGVAGSTGIDTVKSSISFSLVNSVHVLGSFENLTLIGATNINGTGNALNNVLTGNAGINVLNGAAGNDTLNGGTGNDALTGGTGKDIFLFNSALNTPGSIDLNTALPLAPNIDRITDFVVVDDTIQLENAIFTALTKTGVMAAGAFYTGTAAHDADDRIIYNKTTGALLYDSDGYADGYAVQFATLSTKPALTNADFIVV